MIREIEMQENVTFINMRWPCEVLTRFRIFMYFQIFLFIKKKKMEF